MLPVSQGVVFRPLFCPDWVVGSRDPVMSTIPPMVVESMLQYDYRSSCICIGWILLMSVVVLISVLYRYASRSTDYARYMQ